MTCPSTQVYHSVAFEREVYAWTGLGILIFAIRFAVRLRVLPWRELQGDDYMAVVTLLLFISCIVSKMAIYYMAPNTDFDEVTLRALAPCQMKRVIVMSKVNVFLWYAYASFIWGLKAMVLFFFHRLPLKPLQRKLHKIFAIASGLAYVAVIVALTCTCLPFHLGWATLPYPPPRCTSRTQNYYAITIANVATDFAILIVALPLLWQLRVPIYRRIGLTLLLCSGIFVATAALTSLFMSLTDATNTINVNLWGTREEIAGIIAVNAPIIRPMFRRTFWRKNFESSRRSRLPVVRRWPVEEEYIFSDSGRSKGRFGRKLGVITSFRSSLGDPTTRFTMRSASSKHTQSTLESQRVDEDALKELEWAWGVPRDIPHPRGPCPLLPDIISSGSSASTVEQAGGLMPIIEEDDSTMISRSSVGSSQGTDSATGLKDEEKASSRGT